jgi:hypothetical protein
VPAFRLLRVGVKPLIQGGTIECHQDVTVILWVNHLSWTAPWQLEGRNRRCGPESSKCSVSRGNGGTGFYRFPCSGHG